MEITSEKNPKIQQIMRLREKARERKREGLFVIEGLKELRLALRGGIAIRDSLFCKQLVSREVLGDLKRKSGRAGWWEIPKSLYEKVALRESTEGILAIAEMKRLAPEGIKLSPNPLVLVVERVEKPGNLGALLRTADAAALDAVIVCDPNVDVYNPNVIRSSLGCLFTVQVAVSDSREVIGWLRGKGIRILSAMPDGAVCYLNADFRKPSAIVVGSEAEGLSAIWKENSDLNIMIPMGGGIDSLNVSVAAAVILFEAVRQRMER